MKTLSHQIIGDGEPLIFLHGLGADRRQTISALEPLVQKGGLQLIAVDLPAHGESETSENLSFDSFSTHVLNLLDALNISTFHLGGLSMGAGISLNLTLKAPERVKSLILLRPSWLAEKYPSHLELVAKIGKGIKEHGIENAQELLIKDCAYLELKSHAPEVAASLLPLFTRPQAETGAPVLYKMHADCPIHSLEDLRSIKQSALVLDTTYDDLHPQEVALKIADHLPNLHKYATLPPRYLKKEAYESELRAHLSSFLCA